MKVKYSRELDILQSGLSVNLLDYSGDAHGVTHLSTDGRPVLLGTQGSQELVLRSLTDLLNDEKVSLP